MLLFIVSSFCSVLSVYEEHQKLLNELGGTKRGAENGWDRKEKEDWLNFLLLHQKLLVFTHFFNQKTAEQIVLVPNTVWYDYQIGLISVEKKKNEIK